MASLSGKTVLLAGPLNGIGAVVGRRALQGGAQVVHLVTASSKNQGGSDSTSKWNVKEEVRAPGYIDCDFRSPSNIEKAVSKVFKATGRIDVCVVCPSYKSLCSSAQTSVKKFNLINGVNTRGAFFFIQKCIPYLTKAPNPHVLSISPPLAIEPELIFSAPLYSVSVYSMTMFVMSMAHEFKERNIAFNTLWSHGGAMDSEREIEKVSEVSNPSLFAEAAHLIMTRSSREFTGNQCLDDLTMADRKLMAALAS